MFVFLALMLMLMRLCLCFCASENSIRQIRGVRSSYVSAYAYVAGVLTCYTYFMLIKRKYVMYG